MNVNKVLTKDYGNKRVCRLWQNKPKANPIKPNFKGKKARYAELFKLCEYGRQPSPESCRSCFHAAEDPPKADKSRMVV